MSDSPKQQFTAEEIKGHILEYCPALNASFYQDGEMAFLKENDDLIASPPDPHNPNRRLSDLPERFEKQIKTISKAMEYLSKNKERQPISQDYNDRDNLERTFVVANENVSERAALQTEKWQDYVRTRKDIIIPSLIGLITSARKAETMILDRRNGKVSTCIPDRLSATKYARDLFEAHMREAGVVAPEKPVASRTKH